MVLLDKPFKNRGRSIRWLAAISLLLAGCSRTEFLYRNADWFIERWTDDLVTLSDDQTSAWRVRLNQALERHREAELPDLVQLLSAFEHHASGPLSEREVRCLVDEAEQQLRRHGRLAAETAASMLVTLSPRQVDELERRLMERGGEYREKYLNPDQEERAVSREKRFVKRIERWTGRLEPSQSELVRTASRQIPDLAEPWLDYRQGRQQILLNLLRANAEEDALRTFLTAWWVDRAGRSVELEQSTDAAVQDFITLISRLSVTLSPEQRLALVERVSDLRVGLTAVLTPEALQVAGSDSNLICESVGS